MRPEHELGRGSVILKSKPTLPSFQGNAEQTLVVAKLTDVGQGVALLLAGAAAQVWGSAPVIAGSGLVGALAAAVLALCWRGVHDEDRPALQPSSGRTVPS